MLFKAEFITNFIVGYYFLTIVLIHRYTPTETHAHNHIYTERQKRIKSKHQMIDID